MRSFAIWVAWQVFMQADLIVHENVLGFDIRVLEFFFGATHVCIPFVEDPAEQGLPTKRPRRLTAFVKNEHKIVKTSVTTHTYTAVAITLFFAFGEPSIGITIYGEWGRCHLG